MLAIALIVWAHPRATLGWLLSSKPSFGPAIPAREPHVNKKSIRSTINEPAGRSSPRRRLV
jgi:hypothetical protein